MQLVNSYRSGWAIVVGSFVLAWGLAVPTGSIAAQEQVGNKPFVFGANIRAGGRFDNVRMCVASPVGAKGGPAADVSLSTEIGLKDTLGLEIDLPLFRPILFGAVFKMLQFEPSVTLKFRRMGKGRVDLVGGPTIGLSFHYGPDYDSASSGKDRKPSFFAMGPIVGGYMGLDFKRPCEVFNFQLGLTPYVEPLFGIKDPQNHRGVSVGGLLDLQFRFGKPVPPE